MDRAASALARPKFRDGVRAVVAGTDAEIVFGGRRCAFGFPPGHAVAVERLLREMETGGRLVSDLAVLAPELSDVLPQLLGDFDELRLLTESEPQPVDGVRSGGQLYREVRRVADCTAARVARSSFHRALVEHRATAAQLIGYALEYYVVVVQAPGLIAPALSTAQTSAERAFVQDFLRSELGHDRFLAAALQAAGVSQKEMDLHQPLPATFALCASLGVYARQHPLSFKACLFLFERAQPEFLDAFDVRCRELGMPAGFSAPLRRHAELNDEFGHEDISRSLMELERVVTPESCAVVKRHVSLVVETMIRQEEQILSYYGAEGARSPRIFDAG